MTQHSLAGGRRIICASTRSLRPLLYHCSSRRALFSVFARRALGWGRMLEAQNWLARESIYRIEAVFSFTLHITADTLPIRLPRQVALRLLAQRALVIATGSAHSSKDI
jgi:hypothetical protein